MKILFLLLISFTFFKESSAQTLSVSGGWTSTLATANITEAGNNYISGSLFSATNQNTITVNSGILSVAYVYIQKSDTSWNSTLILNAKRTGNGTGVIGFSTSNGTTYQAVTNTPQYFFETRPGVGTQVSNIPIQYSITGFTVLLPAKAYTTTLLYTVTN